jgi:hypothetical protein
VAGRYLFEIQIDELHKLLMGNKLLTRADGEAEKPPPLALDEHQYRRVRDHMTETYRADESHAGEVLLVEILAALRSIDDKLSRMQEKGQ